MLYPVHQTWKLHERTKVYGITKSGLFCMQVVYAAAARGSMLDDHTAVSQTGVATAAQAFQVRATDVCRPADTYRFASPQHQP